VATDVRLRVVVNKSVHQYKVVGAVGGSGGLTRSVRRSGRVPRSERAAAIVPQRAKIERRHRPFPKRNLQLHPRGTNECAQMGAMNAD